MSFSKEQKTKLHLGNDELTTFQVPFSLGEIKENISITTKIKSKDSKEKIINYYTSVFQWLYKCEKIFGFDLKGYGQKRMYGFSFGFYCRYSCRS